MRNIFKVFFLDTKRLSKNVVAVVIIMGLSVLPSLYAWFNIFSNWDPYGPDATSNLKVAVVSEDDGVDISGTSINIGSSVIEALKENSTIGWVFADNSDDAIDGVYSGDYYAALVIPEKFTSEMISFLGGEIEHPDIIYYENEKKNAIAPKITQKAKGTVQEQVNSTFVSTLAESLIKVGNAVSGASDEEGSSIADTVLERLNDLSGDLQSYVNILNSFTSIMNSAESIVQTSQAMLPNLDNMVATGQASVNGMQSLLIGANGTTDSVTDMVSYSFTMINSTLDGVSSVVNSQLDSLSGYEQGAQSGISGAQAVLPYLQTMLDNAVSGWEGTTDDATKAKIEVVRTQLGVLNADIGTLSENASLAAADVTALKNRITTEITNCKNAVKALQDSFTYSVKPQLDSTMNAMGNSMVAAAAILDGVDADFGEVDQVLSDYQKTLQEGGANLSGSLQMAQELQNGLAGVIADIVSLKNDEQYQELVEIMETDPQMLGSFISSPVNLDTVGIYEIENYGSAMAPFYTILALWVGGLILVAIIHVKVEPEEELLGVKPYQTYFGRYIIFFLVGQTQTLITVLGDLFYIRIQCHNPFLFWLAAAVSSLVFTLFMYSLTVAFGNVGEALAIVVMVIQVAGAGGTFPIEVLPKVYQNVYKYLPFPYGMNAMRETIGGIYKMDYWKCIGCLGIYVVISLFIGLVVAIPFRRLNHMIEKSKENTGIMI